MDPTTATIAAKIADPFVAQGLLGSAVVALALAMIWLYIHKERSEERCRKQVELATEKIREIEQKRLEMVLEIANRATSLIERNTTTLSTLNVAVEAARSSTSDLARGFAAMAAANEDAQERLTERTARMEANQAHVLDVLSRRQVS